MKQVIRLAAAGIILGAALAPTAFGEASNDPAFANTVISIEGRTGNVLQPSWVAVRKTGTRMVRDSQGTRVRISARSVLSQALLGTSEAKVALRWSWYPEFGAPWITSIAGQGPKGAQGWNFRVNSLYLARAANRVNLSVGDRVTWYWGKEFATVLEIAAPKLGIAAGASIPAGPFTAKINEVTSKNVRTPSAGATVTYGTATGVTGPDGTVTFTTQPGVNVLRVTKAGRIPATKQLCTIGAPECNIS